MCCLRLSKYGRNVRTAKNRSRALPLFARLVAAPGQAPGQVPRQAAAAPSYQPSQDGTGDGRCLMVAAWEKSREQEIGEEEIGRG